MTLGLQVSLQASRLSGTAPGHNRWWRLTVKTVSVSGFRFWIGHWLYKCFKEMFSLSKYESRFFESKFAWSCRMRIWKYVYLYIDYREAHTSYPTSVYIHPFFNIHTSCENTRFTPRIFHESQTSGLHWSGLHGKSGTINVRICWISTAQGVLSKENLGDCFGIPGNIVCLLIFSRF